MMKITMNKNAHSDCFAVRNFTHLICYNGMIDIYYIHIELSQEQMFFIVHF